jgi:hypothetical protein
MKRILLVSIVLILSLSCWRSEDYNVDLSTPEKTLKTYYEAFKTSDFKHQKRTIEGSIESIDKKRFDMIRPILQSYQILKIREAKDREKDTFHLPEGDVDAMVKEIYKDNNENMVSFVLRKSNNKWLIIDVLYLEKSDILEDSKLIEEEMKKNSEPR